MNKFFLNIFAFITAFLIVISIVFFSKNEIFNYYAKPLQDSLLKTVSLQSDLENGKIVVFGSSELVMYPNQKFLPQNFFNNDLKLPLRVQGNEGQQIFAIFSQIAACLNEETKENARLVILLSPSWFTGDDEGDNGTKMPKFLEFMYPGMMNKLYFQSNVDDEFKIIINNYVKNNLNLIKNPNFIYEYSFDTLEEDYLDNAIKKIIIQQFDNKDINQQVINYIKPNLDYKSLENEAIKVSLSTSNNIYGVNNEYFVKNIQPEIDKNNFPFSILVPSSVKVNEEYQHLLILINLLKDFKIKPLFVMQDLNPYIFNINRDKMNDLMKTIKQKVQENNFEYLDMWTYDKDSYVIGSQTDIVHPGELSWLKVDKKIIDYFMSEKGN